MVYYQCCVLIGWTSTRLWCYSPLVAKCAGFENRKKWRLNRVLLAKVVLSRYFWPTSWILLKQLFLSASWAIDSEPIRARGIIVNYIFRKNSYTPLLNSSKYNLLAGKTACQMDGAGVVAGLLLYFRKWCVSDSYGKTPLSPKSGQCQYSLNNINTSSREKFMRIDEMITEEKMLWSLIKLSLV